MNPTQICVYTSVGVVYTNWCFVYTQKCHQWTLEYGVPPGGSHQRGSAMAEDQESAPLHAADIKGTVEMPPALRPPTLASGQMSRDGSVPAAAGARRGDGQTAPAPRGRLAASIGCVSHHRMVWGPPHRARTPALRPPTLARGQMSRCSDGSVPAAAGARRGDGQTVPVPRGRLAASIGCVSHHRMVWGPPHRARTPALRPPTRARGQMSRCSDGSVRCCWSPPR